MMNMVGRRRHVAAPAEILVREVVLAHTVISPEIAYSARVLI